MGRHHLEMSRMEKCKHWSGSLLPVRNLFQRNHLAKAGGRELESYYPPSVLRDLGHAFPDRDKISSVPLFISQHPALSKEPWYHIQTCAKLWKLWEGVRLEQKTSSKETPECTNWKWRWGRLEIMSDSDCGMYRHGSAWLLHVNIQVPPLPGGMDFSQERMFFQLNWRRSTVEAEGPRPGKEALPLNIWGKDFEGMGESERASFRGSLPEGVPQLKDRDDLGQQEWWVKIERILGKKEAPNQMEGKKCWGVKWGSQENYTVRRNTYGKRYTVWLGSP